jgi:S1 RNA binding domain protein
MYHTALLPIAICDGGMKLKMRAKSEPQKPRPARRDDSRPNVWEPKKQTPMSELSFEDMISRFKQNSEERMCDLKRSTDRKNGTRRK